MKIITTTKAPKAIGPYNQAIQSGNTVYLSGQIPLHPEDSQLVGDTIEAQIHQVIQNIAAVCEATGGSLQHIVKLTIYLTDLSHFDQVNDIMQQYFKEPYPARATIGVSSLPKGASVEMDGIMVIE